MERWLARFSSTSRFRLTRMDPIALKVQALLPLPNTTDPTRQLINNYNVPLYSNQKITSNPSLKIDHNLSPTIKFPVTCRGS